MGKHTAQKQDAGPFEVVIIGGADWRQCLAIPIKLSPEWSAFLDGRGEVPYIDYARKEAELNGHTFERSVIIALLKLGYKLEELEVEFDAPGRENWGRCVWYKDHAEYQKPIHTMYAGTAVNDPSLYHAMWKTEHAGDQHSCFYSTQMMASTSILSHKTIIYRKVVLTPPSTTTEMAA